MGTNTMGFWPVCIMTFFLAAGIGLIVFGVTLTDRGAGTDPAKQFTKHVDGCQVVSYTTEARDAKTFTTTPPSSRAAHHRQSHSRLDGRPLDTERPLSCVLTMTTHQ